MKHAKIIKGKPPFIKGKNTATQAQRQGNIYEYKVAQFFSNLLGESRVLHGPWIQYEDDNGRGWCQPDILIFPESDTAPILILECKLTSTETAKRKLTTLYGPCIEGMFPERPAPKLAQVCRYVRRSKRPRGLGQRLKDYKDLLVDNPEWDFATINLRKIY